MKYITKYITNKDRLVLVMCSIAGMVYISQKAEIWTPGAINHYLNDLLCMPIVLYSCLKCIRFLKSDAHQKIPILLIIVLTTGYAWYFEYYLPSFNPRYTADLVDVLLYFIGATFFYVFLNTPSGLVYHKETA